MTKRDFGPINWLGDSLGMSSPSKLARASTGQESGDTALVDQPHWGDLFYPAIRGRRHEYRRGIKGVEINSEQTTLSACVGNVGNVGNVQ